MIKSNRRRFLTSVAGAAAAGSVNLGTPQRARGAISGPPDHSARAYDMRIASAESFRAMSLPKHQPNGDEELYADKRNSFAKCLPHDDLGRVRPDAYESMTAAINSGRTEDYKKIPMGGQLKLKNPQAAHSYAMEGLDTHQFLMRPAPTFASAEQAGELVEVYWQSLTRDIPFSEYETNRKILDACEDLTRMSDFRGPKIDGRVTPGTFARADFPGVLNGPYLSQFLLLPVASGATKYEQKVHTELPGSDYLTLYATWLDTLRGAASKTDTFDPVLRYVRSGRDLAAWLHRDWAYQGYLNAALIMLEMGSAFRGGLDVVRTYSDNNPLLYSTNEEGFVTWGAPDITELVARVSKLAFQACWCQKWLVHRRARPDEIAGHVHNHVNGRAQYDFHSDLLNSAVLRAVESTNGSYLLSQAFSEGSPSHPAYPSGHSTMSGACATVLKAFFREDFVIPNPVVPSPDGLELLPYNGPPLTLGGEINKLVSNIGIGRDWAGIHWRTDFSEGVKLGEEVAIHALRDFGKQYTDDFGGFTFTKFDGERITVCPFC
jgi:membrane-associated phospholipid phosphatase